MTSGPPVESLGHCSLQLHVKTHDCVKICFSQGTENAKRFLLTVILCYTDLNWGNKVNIHIVVYRLILLSALTMAVTDRSFSCPRPVGGTVPLG